jgi:hypothetical protein
MAQLVSRVAARYTDAGWTVITLKQGLVNDLIASKGPGKLHFVAVRNRSEAEINIFIQNAMSNGALPVVVTTSGDKMTFEDVNSRARILLRGKPTEPQSEEPEKPKASSQTNARRGTGKKQDKPASA